ncbi:hypothetical protein SAMD00023378_3961 [Ralstonia sp. NT80]|uniref:hypothetical protein n=1 Tax=Ralstonia sp. NT80 TaxID=1218247 RepID=UPI00066E465E|nr:hypothetical protein [Ralstonia sp. NT80]GAQ30278.1 hypothetical protein SAMD00023378_3961 [Ralstonia sp. NT80]
MDVRFTDPRKAVLTESGYGLDAIGALDGVRLPRMSMELDAEYRQRLSAKLGGDAWAEIIKLARDDPAAHRAVYMVSYRDMSLEEAALQLALTQTKAVAILKAELMEALKYSVRPVKIGAQEWRGPAHEGPAGVKG